MSHREKIPSRRFLVIATTLIVAVGLLGAGFILGVGAMMMIASPDETASTANLQVTNQPAEPMLYTCSMHPQVRLPDPEAKCPICFMDLIPVEQSEGIEGDLNAPILSMSSAAMKLADIRTTPVRRFMPRVEVRLDGKIDYDETRLATISAYFSGRLDNLFVDFTGIPVKRGDHLVSIYSPELFTAETELLSNLEAFHNLDQSASSTSMNIAASLIQVSRDKLRLWGLTREQIQEIERTKIVSDHMTIYSPIGGVVIQKHKVEGEYVDTGDPIYSVADLSHLWVRLDAYESDLRWLRYGQDVEFTTETFPGEVFLGQIAFINPEVSSKTRTVKLRVNIANEDGRLKPGMFLRAVVRPVISGEGVVVATDLAGKLVCSMHPEIVKDEQAPCDLCGMDLTPAEELGYVSAPNDDAPPLVIPVSAPLITGQRAVVYVKLADHEQPTFEGRQITLGPRAGDYYIVREDMPGGTNLAEGELVVVNGNFKIDSALQIQARTSMMSPTEELKVEPSLARLKVPEAFIASLGDLYDGYLWMQEGLAGDRLAVFQEAAGEMHGALDDIRVDALSGEARMAWTGLTARLSTNREHIEQVADIEAARQLFETYSIAMIELGRRFGYAGSESINITFCPMAFDNKGASWLQAGNEINNPYFGASMLRCGEITGSINGSDKTIEAKTPESSTQPDPGGVVDEPLTDTRGNLIVNTICPIMGNEVDPETPTVMWRDHTIGFCCPGCEGPWNEMAEADKDAFVAKSLPDAERQSGEVEHDH